jgi:lysophospholipase L1-like esterase
MCILFLKETTKVICLILIIGLSSDCMFLKQFIKIGDMKKMIFLMIRNGGLLFFAFLMLISEGHLFAQTDKWVGTWSCAPYAAGNNTPPEPYLEGNTLRQIVRCSLGGDTIRVKFSNITCSNSVTMKAVNIAVVTKTGGSAIDVSTVKKITFNGGDSVTMAAYTSVTSDPLTFSLEPNTQLAISIYYGECETVSDMTHHYGSRTDSYILEGNQTESATFAGATAIERWYTINTIDVQTSEASAAIAVLGNSITDGYGLHGGLKNKWTDVLSERLLDNATTSHISVLNLGIGATWLSSSGVNRFQQDILDQNGLRWIIIFYGVNDIGGGASAETIISAYKSLIDQAHAEDIRIYGATITPFKGHGYYSEAHEAVRQEVNEWIRFSGYFDKVIDFNETIRDSSDTLKLQAEYSNDWLHPNADGYKLLGESVNLDLFLGEDTVFEHPVVEAHYFEAECANVGSDWSIVADQSASNGYYVVAADGVQSLDVAPSDEKCQIIIPFSVDSTENYVVYARVNCASADDDSYWVKLDDGRFVMCNGLTSAGWQWVELQSYNLSEGSHTLSIAYREDGAKLDKIAVSASSSSPYNMGEEAENICQSTKIERVTMADDAVWCDSYPNPFKDKTTIRFFLNDPDDVSLSIYDMRGNVVNIYLAALILINGVARIIQDHY